MQGNLCIPDNGIDEQLIGGIDGGHTLSKQSYNNRKRMRDLIAAYPTLPGYNSSLGSEPSHKHFQDFLMVVFSKSVGS